MSVLTHDPRHNGRISGTSRNSDAINEWQMPSDRDDTKNLVLILVDELVNAVSQSSYWQEYKSHELGTLGRQEYEAYAAAREDIRAQIADLLAEI